VPGVRRSGSGEMLRLGEKLLHTDGTGRTKEDGQATLPSPALAPLKGATDEGTVDRAGLPGGAGAGWLPEGADRQSCEGGRGEEDQGGDQGRGRSLPQGDDRAPRQTRQAV